MLSEKIRENIQAFANLLGYTIVPTYKKGYISESIVENEFGTIYRKCKDYSLTSLERMYALYKSVEYVVKSQIPGDFVECGVWRGGSAMVMAHALIKMKETSRRIWLYDTFEGMSKPSEEDTSCSDGSMAINKWRTKQTKDHCEWDYASLDEVTQNMLLTGYPEENLFFIKGRIEDTVPEHMPSRIALLRLDTDWYESTKHELNHLFPLLIKHGILIIDDYGHWAGSRKAVDEYFSQKKLPILLNRIDYTGRIAVKINE